MPLTLGLIMIARNEALNLPRSLGPAAAYFDQTLLLDTGSTDQTRETAAQMGARVHSFTWQDDFAAARNRCIDLAETDWLLWLDADNAIADLAALSALRRLLPEKPAIIWGLERVTGSGEMLWQKRVFPRSPQARFQGLVHEQLIHPADWPNLVSELVIDHWGYEDPANLRRKGIYYLELLQKTLQNDPNDHYARFQAARCHFNLREFEQARQQLELAAQADAENAELGLRIELMRATVLERLGQADQALRQLLQLTQKRPDSALAFFSAGKLAYASGDYALAASMLERSLTLDLGAPVIDLNPRQTRFTANYLLGLACGRLGQTDRGISYLEAALRLEPKHRGVRLDLAEMAMRQDNRQSAMRHLNNVLHDYPQDARARRLAREWKEHA